MLKMKHSELTAPEAELLNISNINIILGRNGSGKSRFLRALDIKLSGESEFNVRYISPERAGVFKRDANVQNNMENNISWLRDVRRTNQAVNFKAASANLLREIEVIYLRRLQDSISIRRVCQGFCVRAEIKQACALQTQLRIGLKRSSNLESAWSTF
jgi:ATPase subunit of ABC transporter with duplicated ATPase domains